MAEILVVDDDVHGHRKRGEQHVIDEPDADKELEVDIELVAVVAAEPNLTEALYQLSRVYVRLKRKEDAEKTLAAFKRLSDDEKKQELTERKDLVRRLANVKF